MQNLVNASGADGGGKSVKIYETPDHESSRRGACVIHGSLAAGPSSPDCQRIEVVELGLPGIDVRVRADDVRAELRALLAALAPWEQAGCPEVGEESVRHAFDDLYVAVMGVVAGRITVGHLEAIAREAHDYGVKRGRELLRQQFRDLMDL